MRFFQSNKLFIIIPVLLLAGKLTTVIAQTPVQVTIDAKSSRKPVSPYIYGKNNCLNDNGSALSASQWQLLRDAGIMMFRESGGNNSTKYNWRRKLSSHPDWYNNVYSHDWDFAAGTLLKNIPAASGMWTLPLIGKAARTNAANFNDWNYNGSKWWTGCAQNLAGGGTMNPKDTVKALKDGNPDLYLENWPADSVVGILTKWFGANGLGYDKSKLRYWNMDNEPEIWNGTHDDVMKTQLSAEEFMQRYFETAKKARALFPEIKLVGPVPANEWQWYNWNGDRILSGGKYYTWLEYFIKRIADEQKASGIRLLDVLDIHFYPGETAAADIVQLHRVYFDRTYVYPGNNGLHRLGSSGWDSSINKEYIFGRCQEWLDKYMGTGHGVTFSVTETGINTSDANVRAVWYASTLGEFAKQGMEIFTPWSWSVGMYEVVHLFSKYNHDNYLNATSGDEQYVSAYTTVNAQADSMTIVLVNRSVNTTKETEVKINNYTLGSGTATYYRINGLTSTETFKSHQSNALKSGTVTPVGNGLNISLPPLSVTSLLVKGTPLNSAGFSLPEKSDFKLTVFPNPAGAEFTVRWKLRDLDSGEIEVIDASGHEVFAHTLNSSELCAGKLHFSTIGWLSGIYYVRFKSEGYLGSAKLNVIH